MAPEQPLGLSGSTPGLTRRALARRGAGLAVAAGSTGLIGTVLAAPAAGQDGGINRAISGIIELENTLVVVYEEALRSGTLSSENRKLANVFASQSAQKAQLLRKLLGSAAPPQPPKPSEIVGLDAVNTGRRYIEVAGNFENQAYLGYIDALDATAERGAILLLSQLAASTAQHLALLREALGHVPAPSAFETGLNV